VRNGSGTALASNTSLQDVIGTGITGGAGLTLQAALGTTGTATTDSAASLVGIIGSNTATTAFASGNVVADEDGNVLERLEQIQEAVNRGTGLSLPANTSIFDFLERGVKTGTAVVAAGTATIFTVAGGPIVVTHLVGVCVTGNDTTATLLKFTADPTDGGATDLSAASATLASAAAGTMLNITGTVANATVITVAGTAIEQAGGIVVPAGVIQTITTGGVTTGTWYFAMRYKPLAPGVTVTAAY
jgi:hypothetical protein